MSCENSTVIDAFHGRENFQDALPPEMIFWNFMMFKIPYAVKRELFIFCFCHENIQGEMSGWKRCVFFLEWQNAAVGVFYNSIVMD